MEKPKRSKKFGIIAAVLVLLAGVLIGGYLVLKSGSGVAGQLEQILSGASLAVGECKPNPYDSDIDSDNDGLKDWQEMQIHKTDACKADTDGDGYLDGEEIASGYDPTKKAPGDELPGAKSPRPLPGNLTEALRQKLAAQIVTDKIVPFNSRGEMLSVDELENYPAVGQTVQEIMRSYSGLFAPDKIDDGQIETTPDNSKAAIQAYATMAISACCPSKIKFSISSKSETEMFLTALENNDFSEMDSYLQQYRTIYENLKKLTVPTDFLPLHKEQLEIFSSLIKIYSAIKEINTDPLKANLALQSYQAVGSQFNSWTLKFADFINRHP